MIEKFLFGGASFSEAKAALDAGTLRQRVIASNIANANTPGYQSREVTFEELLGEAESKTSLETTRPGHIQSGPEASAAAKIVTRPTDPDMAGINNVEVESELVDLQQNSVHYQALSKLLVGKYRGIQAAIRTS